MGVSGLWQLVSPYGRRVSLDVMANKAGQSNDRVGLSRLSLQILAIDASIWMYHFVRAMPPNKKGPHMLGFFRRLCKLLFLKVKPIIVFDGPAPKLKRDTIAKRAREAEKAEARLRRTAQQLVKNRLLQKAASRVESEGTTAGAQGSSSSSSSTTGATGPDGSTAEVADSISVSSSSDSDASSDSEWSSARTLNGVPSSEEERRNEPSQRRRRWRYNKAVPSAFRGFLAERRGLDDIQVSQEAVRELEDMVQDQGQNSKSGGYDLDTVAQLPTMVRYKVLLEVRERVMNDGRARAIHHQAVAGAEGIAFASNTAQYMELVRVNEMISKTKLEIAKEEEEHRLAAKGEDSTAKGIYVPPEAVTSSSSSPSPPPEFEWRQKKKSRSRYMNNLDNLNYAPMEDFHLKHTLEEVLSGSPDSEAEGAVVKTEEKAGALESSDDALGNDSDSSSGVDFDNMFADDEPQGVKSTEEDEVAEVPLLRLSPARGRISNVNSDPGRSIGRLKVNLKRKGTSKELSSPEEIIPDKASQTVPLLVAKEDGICDVKMGADEPTAVLPQGGPVGDDGGELSRDSSELCAVHEPNSVAVSENEEGTVEMIEVFANKRPIDTATQSDIMMDDRGAVPASHKVEASPFSSSTAAESSSPGHLRPGSSVELPTAGDLTQPKIVSETRASAEPAEEELELGAKRLRRERSLSASRTKRIRDEARKPEGVSLDRPPIEGATRTAWVPQPRTVGQPRPSDDATREAESAEAKAALEELDDIDIDALVEIERKMIDIEEMPKPRNRSRNKANQAPLSAIDDLQNKLRVEEKLLEDNVNKLAKQQTEVDFRALKEEIQLLLTAFGIPWVDAPCEAEAQCVALVQNGLADGVISDDSDTLMYGADVVLRRLYFDAMYVEMYSSNRMPDRLREQDAMVSLAMLLGCDYTPGVLGIGAVNALEIIEAGYVGMERLLQLRVWASALVSEDPKEIEAPVPGEEGVDSLQLRQFKRDHGGYRSTWTFPKDFPRQDVWDALSRPVVDDSKEPFSWAEPDALEIEGLMSKYTDMTQESVAQLLRPVLEKEKSTMVQRRITDYFAPKFDRGRVVDVHSKRMQKAVKGLAREQSKKRKAATAPVELDDEDDEWHSRREFILDMDPYFRKNSGMWTEWERKTLLFLFYCCTLATPYSAYLDLQELKHQGTKPPRPVSLESRFMNQRRYDFTWMHPQDKFCSECRPVELECKKMCFDRYRSMDYRMYGFQRPRIQTFYSFSTW
ncbi:Excision repair cross-complementing rodent repair deficiency, complementation group 5 [Perkinsus olseni]|uniref:Excision repair cross-complementing rodent repair deficiency, complementation group 5 n=1 Tax=Perkinsus olseni TaxID=32597 RepID=A0A7J6LI51_PEROL|nr:Excision repair cross-complementing rodent repair deficiency, complementation group 5 [Perkinsus olseni]